MAKRINYKEIANALIDNYCETEGVRDCISFLLDIGVTKDELLKMNFDPDDIEAVEENEADDDED